MDRVQSCNRHQSVLVRGIERVACLSHLDMRDPEIGRICDEFEQQSKGHASANDTSPALTSQTEQAEQIEQAEQTESG